MIVKTKDRTAVVPPELPRRASPNGQMHACISATGRLICIFMPPDI
jgi:hypothetical protein